MSTSSIITKKEEEGSDTIAKKDNVTDKDESKSGSKDITDDNLPIPNTLTIFINTRIRNYSKIRYEPSMTIPKSKSKSVYFNPLIKLNSSIANRLPNGVSKNEKFTQFFNKNEFTSLIGRTLSSTSQKKLNLIEATESGYVDNNIRVTLDELFSRNNIFYIKDQPYTVYSYTWNKGDWRVDTKSFEKEFPYIPYGSSLSYFNERIGNISQSKATRELKKLQKKSMNLVEGPTANESWSKFSQKENKLKPGETKDKIASVQTRDEKLDQIKKNIKNLPEAAAEISKNLIYLILIGSPENSNFGTNPLTQLLFYQEPDSLKTYVTENIKILGPSYTEMIDSYNQCLKEINAYYDLLGNLYNQTQETSSLQENFTTKKKLFDKLTRELKKKLIKYKTGKKVLTIQEILLDDALKRELFQDIQKIINLKKEILDLLLKLYEKINNIRNYLKIYYEKIVKFYTLLSKTKKYKDKSINELFKLVIQFDIECFQNLSSLININSSKVLILKEDINKYKLNLDKSTLSEKLKIYFDFPSLLNIEIDELDSDYFKIASLIENLKLNIFNYLYESTANFLNNDVKNYALEKIYETKKIMLAKYNTDDPNSKVKIIESANAITFFSKVSLICMARENNYYISKLNLLNIYESLARWMRNYYVLILQEITGQRRIYKYEQELKKKEQEYKSKYKSIKGLLPELLDFFDSILFPFDNPVDFDSLILKIKILDDFFEKFKNEILEYQFYLRTIVPKYKNKVNDFVPKLSNIAILMNCEEIFNSDSAILKQPYSFNEIKEKWLKDKLFDNIDFNTRENFIEYLYLLVDNGCFEIFDIYEFKKLLQNLQIYKDSDILKFGKTGDSIFGAITIAFNGTLITNNKKSNNPYAILSSGKDTVFEGYYSPRNLRKAVAENFDEDSYDFFKDIRFLFDKSISKFIENNDNVAENISKIRDMIEISEEDDGTFGEKKIIIPMLSKIFGLHIMVLIEFSEKNMPKKGDIVMVITENGRRLANPYVGVITDIKSSVQKTKSKSKALPKEVTLYSIKNIDTYEIKDGFKITHFEYISENKNYKFDCELDGITKKYFEKNGISNEDLEKMPKIYLIEKNDENHNFPYFELLYFQNSNVVKQEEVDVSTLKKDKLEISEINFDDESNIYPDIRLFNGERGLNNQIQRREESGNKLLDDSTNIQKCNKSNENIQQYAIKKNIDLDKPSEVEKVGNNFVFLPEGLYGFDVAKNVGGGNCAITAILLCVYENYQKMFTVQHDINPDLCIDNSTERAEIGKTLRRVLTTYLKGNDGKKYFNGLSSADKDEALEELSDFKSDEDKYGYLHDSVFQIFSNFFGFNILIYNAVTDSFKYYLVNGNIDSVSENNGERKWIIIYQSGNHYSPFFKIKSNGEYIFQFSNKIINYILNKATEDQKTRSPDIVELLSAFNYLIEIGNFVPISDTIITSDSTKKSKSFVFIFNKDDEFDENIMNKMNTFYDINCNYNTFGSKPIETPKKITLSKPPIKTASVRSSPRKSKDKVRNVSFPSGGGNEDEDTVQIIQHGGIESVVPKSSYFNVYNSNQYTSDESALSYYVIVDLELYPGKDGIPASQRAVLSCQVRYEKIRQAYSNLFGLEYRPNEFNSSIYNPKKTSNKKEKEKEKEKEKGTRRYRRNYYPNYYTRRDYNHEY